MTGRAALLAGGFTAPLRAPLGQALAEAGAAGAAACAACAASAEGGGLMGVVQQDGSWLAILDIEGEPYEVRA